MTTTIVRMSDSEYDNEYGTPRPGMNQSEAAERIEEANKSIASFSVAFANAAKATAVAMKRRRSLRTSTFYKIASSPQVKRALDNLEKENEKIPDATLRIPKSDLEMLKCAFEDVRLRLIVHDRYTREQLIAVYTQAQKDEKDAEIEMQNAYSSKNAEEYLKAKDIHQDKKFWRMDVSNELARTLPKLKAGTQEMFPGIPSQHAQIPEATGVHFRNILKPETIRRKFISLDALTIQIKKDVTEFLSQPGRHKDRIEVIQLLKLRSKKMN